MKTIILETEENKTLLTEKEFIALAKKEWKDDTEGNEDWKEDFAEDYPRSENEIDTFNKAVWFIENWFMGRYIAITFLKDGNVTRLKSSRYSNRYTITKELNSVSFFDRPKYDKDIRNLVSQWNEVA